MKKLILTSAFLSFAIACDSPVNTGSNSSVAKSNVNAANKIPYSQTENAYSLTQRDIELSQLEDLVGKTATEMKLWQNKAIIRRLKDLMGPDLATMQRYWNTETPMKKFGDILMLTGCEQKNCVNNRYVIFISLSEGFINVVHVGKETVREWKTRGRIDLPPPFVEELDAMKSRREEENGN
jgi:hypothetical protein